jgi:hypothetical protein
VDWKNIFVKSQKETRAFLFSIDMVRRPSTLDYVVKARPSNRVSNDRFPNLTSVASCQDQQRPVQTISKVLAFVGAVIDKRRASDLSTQIGQASHRSEFLCWLSAYLQYAQRCSPNHPIRPPDFCQWLEPSPRMTAGFMLLGWTKCRHLLCKANATGRTPMLRALAEWREWSAPEIFVFGD